MYHRVQLEASLRAGSVMNLRTYSEVYLGAYSVCTRECLESLLGSVQSSRLGVCHRVQLGASLRACSRVYLRTYSEVYLGASCVLTWERIVKQAGSVIECNWECI